MCFNTKFSLQPDALNAQFSHMTLAQQPPGNSGASAPDARHYPAVYHHHPSQMVLQGAPQQQQQIASYMVAGPSGGPPGVLQGQPVPTPGPNHTYPSSTSGPAAFSGSTLNQQLLQQHTYIHQPVQQVGTSKIMLTVPKCGHLSTADHSRSGKPALWLILHFSSCWEVDSNGIADLSHSPWTRVVCLFQMSACYCSSAHHPHCSSQQQHYRPPVNPLSYNCPQSQNLPQQQGMHTVVLKKIHVF